MRGRSRHWLGSKSLASRPLLASQQVFAVPQPSASAPRKTSQCSRLIPPRNRASAKSCQCWRAQAASRLHNSGQDYSYGQSQEQRLKPISPIPCAVITRTLQMPDGNGKLGPSQPHQKERFLSEDASEGCHPQDQTSASQPRCSMPPNRDLGFSRLSRLQSKLK